MKRMPFAGSMGWLKLLVISTEGKAGAEISVLVGKQKPHPIHGCGFYQSAQMPYSKCINFRCPANSPASTFTT
jgi:hypothetical protein